MNVTITNSIAKGTVRAPASKSILHRYIICASLSGDESTIGNFDTSKDIEASIACARALGAEICIKEKSVVIKGNGAKPVSGQIRFCCNESGSTMRFFMGIAMGLGCDACFYGSETLLNRPMDIYEDICRKHGIVFERKRDHIRICGKLAPGEFSVPGNISSQFITGLMFALPVLDKDSVIKMTTAVESGSYIDLTVRALSKFGINIEHDDRNEYRIKGSQRYHSCDLDAEGDYSNAAFLDAFNCLGGHVKVTGLDPHSLQGDRVYKELFKKLENENATIDISDCPDLGPVLMGIAALKNGAVFTGTARLKIKESDRGQVMCTELAKLGIDSVMEEDRIEILKSTPTAPAVAIDAHNDHRIAMTFAIVLSALGGDISGAQAVQKSYPGFFDDIESLGIKVTKSSWEEK